MGSIKNIFYYTLSALLPAAGCKEKYEAPFKSPETGYLVLEGSVNNGHDTTTLILSRTTPLNNNSLQYEPGATIHIEGEDNSIYTLFENTAGHYSTSNLNLNAAIGYKLHITTNSGKEYMSDFVTVRNNPPIDSINWKRENDGLHLYTNAHDPQNNTRYYQWEYTETWQFHSVYASSVKYNIIRGGQAGDQYSAVYRDSADYSVAHQIFTCWQQHTSTNLVLGSTEKLSGDVVFLPLTFIPEGSQKLTVLYSIDVKQHSWSKEGYEFLQRMKKNTEQTGSVFDAQPSELNSNIHCISNPAEPVIGFFNISSLQKKRIFISRNDIPDWTYPNGCFQVEVSNISDSILVFGLGFIPTAAKRIGPRGEILSFYAAEPECVDCTLTGTNIKPSFWP